jgi:hypothetical protein
MTKTLIDTRKENADILIEYANGGSYTIKNQKNVCISGRGVKEVYENGYLEVTSAKLESLKKTYTVECNF